MTMWNTKGQAFLIALMIGVVFVIAALAFAPALKTNIDSARNVSSDTSVGLDCSNSSITNFDKASCVIVDLYNPYFIGFLVFIGIAIISAKLLIGGSNE